MIAFDDDTLGNVYFGALVGVQFDCDFSLWRGDGAFHMFKTGFLI